jgi:hypothetical protein
MKQTTKSTDGTSFHDTTFRATVSELRRVLGEPADANNTGDDKVNYEWEGETDAGDPFTVYDWKNYRPIDDDEKVFWHIGGFNKEATDQARREILDALANPTTT